MERQATTPALNKEKNNNPYARPTPKKCVRCQQPSYRSNVCPNRGRVNVVTTENDDTYFNEQDQIVALEDEYDGTKIVEEDDGEWMNCMIQRLLFAPKQEIDKQRHGIFRTRCTINQKVCDVIIDSGSSENIVSKSLVNKLQLKTEKHPSPYKIGWIKKGAKTKVSKLCRIPFSIGRYYKDEVICNVVDMDACHLLWGRPWQYDVDATHKGNDNTYLLWWHDWKVVLVPIDQELAKVLKEEGHSFFTVPEEQFTNAVKELGEIMVLVVKSKEDKYEATILEELDHC